MSKAILILDKMPKSCEECWLCPNGIDCVINGWVVCSDEGQMNRSSRCPLITEEQYINRVYPVLYDMVVRGILLRKELAEKVSCTKVGE